MTTTQERALSPSNKQQASLDFGNPPVAETAVGFFFQPIEGWNILDHGALWERFRSKYPEYEFLPTLLENPPGPNIRLKEISSLPIRVSFADKTKSQLVQTQNGLLLHNWRKTANVPEYQHYEAMRMQLQEDWSTLESYLRGRSLKSPSVTRCQVDYFNHLVRGEDWQEFSDLPDIFTVWRGHPPAATDVLQLVSFSVSYRMGRGTVNVAVQPAIRTDDGKEIIQFTLSSSVVPESSNDLELFRCLDESHVNAGRAFLDFTTDAAREKWGQMK